MPESKITVLVRLEDGPHALARLLVRCHGRGWVPVSLHSVADGPCCEVAMRLRVPGDRRGAPTTVGAQIGRLVDVEHVAVDAADGVPDAVAFAAVRRRAPWASLTA